MARCSFFVWTLFDIDGNLKRYVGGLVVSTIGCLHIGSLASAMMRVTASLFCGFVVSTTEAQNRRCAQSIDCARCARFDVKDSARALST